MKKFMYLLVATAIFMGCAKKEDDPSNPSGGNNDSSIPEKGITELVISNVKNAPTASQADRVAIYTYSGDGGRGGNKLLVSSAAWNGSSATIPLTMPHPAVLCPATDLFIDATISNPNAKVGIVYAHLIGFVKGSGTNYSDGIQYMLNIESSEADQISLLYASESIKVKKIPTPDQTRSYDLNLLKGWNLIWGHGNNAFQKAPANWRWVVY